MSKVSILIAKDKEQVKKFKKTGISIFNDYKIGWLMQDDKEAIWRHWGSCSTLDKACIIAKNTLKESGEKDVYLSDEPLGNEVMTLDDIEKLKNINDKVKRNE